MNANNNIYTKLTKCFILGLTSFLVTHEAGAGDGISSAEIVGYYKQDLVSGKLNMGGISFLPCDAGKTTFNLNTDLAFENLTPGEGNGDGDEIRVWDPKTSGYTTFYYYNDGDPEYTGWYGMMDEEPELEAGTAFWYYSPVKTATPKSTVVSGVVEMEPSVTDVITGGKLNMLISAYPDKIDLNDTASIEFANLTPGEGNGDGDEIRVWDPKTSGYTTFYYYNDGNPEYTGWYGMMDEEPVLPANTAFWFLAQKGDGKTVTYKNQTK